MATSVPKNYVRRGGSGFTLFTFAGQPITFCQQVAHTSPQPVGQGVSAIQPMDEPHPVEIITPAAAGMGQIVLNMFELFGSNGKASKAWDRLGVHLGSGATPFGPVGFADTSQFLNLSQPAGNNFVGQGDIVDIFIKQAQLSPADTQVVQIIRPPANASGGHQQAPYYIQYVGCVITNVQDGETLDVGTLEVIKQITIAYRYSLRDGNMGLSFGAQGRDANAQVTTTK